MSKKWQLPVEVSQTTSTMSRHLSSFFHPSVSFPADLALFEECNSAHKSIPERCLPISREGNTKNSTIPFEGMSYHSLGQLVVRDRALLWFDKSRCRRVERSSTEHSGSRFPVGSKQIRRNLSGRRLASLTSNFIEHSFVSLCIRLHIWVERLDLRKLGDLFRRNSSPKRVRRSSSKNR